MLQYIQTNNKLDRKLDFIGSGYLIDANLKEKATIYSSNSN